MEDYYDQETLHKVQNVQKEILKDVLKICEENGIDVFAVFGTALGIVRHQGFIPWDDDIDVAMLRKDFIKFKKIAKIKLADRYEFLTPETNKHYAATVVHFQKKGTKFVSMDAKECDYTQGICIDIFVYDNLADKKLDRKIQYFMAWFLGRLVFLSGKGTPFIPYSGITKTIITGAFSLVRKGLRLFRVTPLKIYRKFQSVSQRYNRKKTEYYVAFEPPKPWLNAMSRQDLYPLKKMKFDDFYMNVPNNVDKHLKAIFGDYMQLPPVEKRKNHRPYLVEFGDDKI